MVVDANAAVTNNVTPPAAKLGPMSAAERMRRVRQRSRQGLFCLTLELRQSEVDALVARARLKLEERTSRAAIANAIYSVLDDFVAASVPFRATKGSLSG